MPIAECIDYMSGNSGLTEEFIYQTLQFTGERYAILSSATEERTMMGVIPMCIIGNHPLKVFESKVGLLVTRNGKAGQTRFLTSGNYTVNDHAYILFEKEGSKYRVDLRWLAIQYKKVFLSYSSNADNGTWNMTGFFKYTNIDIPSLHEQIKVIDIYEKAKIRLGSIEKIEAQYESLLRKEIAP